MDLSCRFILVVAFHPVHQVVMRARFVTALWRHVEQHVGTVDEFITAPVGRIGVEDIAAGVAVEHAEAAQILDGDVARGVVVGDLALGDLFRPERDMEVVIEVAAI